MTEDIKANDKKRNGNFSKITEMVSVDSNDQLCQFKAKSFSGFNICSQAQIE